MSGILGILNFDGSPVNPQLLEDLTDSMARQGPDDRQIWFDGPVGFGFSKLATTEEAERETQPLAFAGDYWLVADARIDGRRELISKLESSGSDSANRATDGELILEAYRVWGEGATGHLLGDFSFAIWDRRRRCLFCARDHFGVRPFYYATWPGGVIFSNTIEAVRLHPAVGPKLNEHAIGDYLLFGSNRDLETTTFSDIRRLPPANTVVWSADRRAMRRYWQVAVEPGDPVTPADGWVEQFRSLLQTSVEDRLRTSRVAVLMSGGLDSTAVAALAHRSYEVAGKESGVTCYTTGYDRLISDPDVHHAREVARYVGLPLHYQPLDDYRLGERWGELRVSSEPGNHALDGAFYDVGHSISSEHRVILTGQGGDPILLPFVGYFVEQLRQLRLGRAARYVIDALWHTGRVPPLGLSTRWLHWRLRRNWRQGYPSWLNPRFAARVDLEARWRWYQLERSPAKLHPSHPAAHNQLCGAGWTHLFERFAGAYGVEWRHPLFDLRLVELLLRTPPVPWCIDKRLLREAMRGLLPETVRRRPKTPVAVPPRHALVRPLSVLWQEQLDRAPDVARFVDVERVTEDLRQRELASAGVGSGPEFHCALDLAYWLGSQELPVHR